MQQIEAMQQPQPISRGLLNAIDAIIRAPRLAKPLQSMV